MEAEPTLPGDSFLQRVNWTYNRRFFGHQWKKYSLSFSPSLKITCSFCFRYSVILTMQVSVCVNKLRSGRRNCSLPFKCKWCLSKTAQVHFCKGLGWILNEKTEPNKASDWGLNHQFHQSSYSNCPANVCLRWTQHYMDLFSFSFVLLRCCGLPLRYPVLCKPTIINLSYFKTCWTKIVTHTGQFILS